MVDIVGLVASTIELCFKLYSSLCAMKAADQAVTQLAEEILTYGRVLESIQSQFLQKRSPTAIQQGSTTLEEEEKLEVLLSGQLARTKVSLEGLKTTVDKVNGNGAGSKRGAFFSPLRAWMKRGDIARYKAEITDSCYLFQMIFHCFSRLDHQSSQMQMFSMLELLINTLTHGSPSGHWPQDTTMLQLAQQPTISNSFDDRNSVESPQRQHSSGANLARESLASTTYSLSVTEALQVSQWWKSANEEINRGEFAQAEALLLLIEDVTAKSGIAESSLRARMTLALVYTYQEEYDKAESVLQRVSLEGPYMGKSGALAMHSIASARLFQNRYEDAAKWCSVALEWKAATLGTTNPLYLQTLDLRADLYERQGKLLEADEDRKQISVEYKEYCRNFLQATQLDKRTASTDNQKVRREYLVEILRDRRHTLAFWLWLELGMSTEEQKSALLAASGMGRNDIVDLLACYNSDLEVQDVDKQIPLTIAVRAGHLEVVRSLLEGGANVDGMNGRRQTALLLAVKQRKKAVARLLLKYGANLTTVSQDKESPKSVARAHGMLETLREGEKERTLKESGPLSNG